MYRAVALAWRDRKAAWHRMSELEGTPVSTNSHPKIRFRYATKPYLGLILGWVMQATVNLQSGHTASDRDHIGIPF